MSLNRVIREAVDRNPMGFKDAIAEELQSRMSIAIEAKKAEAQGIEPISEAATIKAGDYSLVRTKEKKHTLAHPDGKHVHELHHNGVKIGTVEPYSAYKEKRKPGARVVTSRSDVTRYSIHFDHGHGPTKSAEMSVKAKYGHLNPTHALEAAANAHSNWTPKSGT